MTWSRILYLQGIYDLGKLYLGIVHNLVARYCHLYPCYEINLSSKHLMYLFDPSFYPIISTPLF